MINISLSFSGKKHEGARLPSQEDADDLIDYTSEDFIHRQKKKAHKPRGRGKQALPRPNTQDGEINEVFVKKEIWMGRRERDPAPRRSRMMRKHGKRFGGGLR